MGIVKHTDLEAGMRDGTVLRSDAYYPDEDKTFPVLLCRTLYDKSAAKQTEIGPELASRGYLVVMQDVRGRYASDGEFQPGFYSADHADAEDGYDTVEWVAGLPWSNGKVGTFGNSYDGWLQWELACTRPPRLVAMMASGITANLLDRELGPGEHDGLFSRQRRHRLRVSVVDDLRWFVRRPRVRGALGAVIPDELLVIVHRTDTDNEQSVSTANYLTLQTMIREARSVVAPAPLPAAD